MFCPKCGARLPDNAVFCSKCGQSIGKPQQGPTPSQAQIRNQGQVQIPPLGRKAKPGASQIRAIKGDWRKKGIAIAAVAAAVVVFGIYLEFWHGLLYLRVPVRASLNDYSWDELSQISHEISKDYRTGSIQDHYNLPALGDVKDTKQVILTDGSTAEVAIVGYNHDDKSDGSGKAGMTFMFTTCMGKGQMNQTSTNSGGWKGCEMRSWLNETGLTALPLDMRSKIVSVRKQTNNTGRTTSASSVTVTDDALWLPSYQEIAGSVGFNIDNASDMLMDVKTVLDAEGDEYSAFTGSTGDNRQDLIRTYNGSPIGWWERSAFSYGSETFQLTNDNGDPGDGTYANETFGVVPGFCI